MTRTGAVVIDRRLYEIHISITTRAARIHMRRVAPNRGSPIHPWARVLGSGSEQQMFDIVLVAGGLALFALSIAYAYACDRL
jgi:hypothetical protein